MRRFNTDNFSWPKDKIKFSCLAKDEIKVAADYARDFFKLKLQFAEVQRIDGSFPALGVAGDSWSKNKNPVNIYRCRFEIAGGGLHSLFVLYNKGEFKYKIDRTYFSSKFEKKLFPASGRVFDTPEGAIHMMCLAE